MDQTLCFIIEGKHLYLEQVLVDDNGIPVFFLCKSKDQYYLALCTDIHALNYIVVIVSVMDVYHLLHGRIPMRDLILQQTEYWDIVSGEDVSSDQVTKKRMDVLDPALLPEGDAVFQILTDSMALYVHAFDESTNDNSYKWNKKREVL